MLATSLRCFGALLLLASLPSCHEETLYPPYAPQGIRLEVSGGFAGVNYTLFLDGDTGQLVGESCINLCGFDAGDVLATLPNEEVIRLSGLFQDAGIHSLDGRDFGSECCDQFYFDLSYEDESGTSTARGTAGAFPTDLRNAIQALLEWMPPHRPVVVDFDGGREGWPMEPLLMEPPAIDGQILSVRVEFSGGCMVHELNAVAWGGWMESDPVQVRVFLSHEDFDDPCDAVLTEDLSFDLNPLKQAYQSAYGIGAPGETTLRVLLEDSRLASALGAWVLDYVF